MKRRSHDIHRSNLSIQSSEMTMRQFLCAAAIMALGANAFVRADPGTALDPRSNINIGTTPKRAALAQTRPISLTNGHQVTLPISVPGCSAGRIDDFNGSQMVTFACGSAEVQAIAATPPLNGTPLAVLHDQAQRWQQDFMSWPADQRSTFLRRESRTLAGGSAATFYCLTYDNVMALEGSSSCILDLPATELIVTATAPMASEAATAVNAVLGQIAYR